MGLFSAPLLLLLYPDLVPAPMILNGLLITSLLAINHRKAIDRKLAPYSIIGGSLGVLGATLVISIVEFEQYQTLFGVSILLAVVLSVAGLKPHISVITNIVAGTLSGFMGTLTAAGGAPMGLLYQAAHRDNIKANLSLFFVYINALGIVSLWFAGAIDLHDLELFLYCTPAILAGWGLSFYLNISITSVRPLILLTALCSGLLLIFR